MLKLYTGDISVGIETLRDRYPWPKKIPDMLEDWQGWLCPDTATALTSRVGPHTQLVVECGSWLGCSARAILDNAVNAVLVCVDTWMGSPEHRTNAEWERRLPTLYETFQRNLWPWRDRVVMLRQDSLVGLGEVYSLGLQPDLIYLDTKHTLGRVTAELALCLELFPETPVVGDDYSNAAVALAAREHARVTGRPMIECGAAFAFEPWRNV